MWLKNPEKKVIGLMLGIMAIASIAIIFIPDSVSAYTIWTVDKINGPCFTIQEAISYSTSGDYIYVYNTGVYSEFVTINKSLSIIGFDNINGNPPIIRPPSANNNNVYITSNKVEFNNFKLDNSLNNYQNVIGIRSIVNAFEHNEVTLKNLEISNYYTGIKIARINPQNSYPRYHVIDTCDIHDNTGYGIEIYSNPNPDVNQYACNFIKESDIDDNGYGIYCYGDYNYFRNLQIHSNNNYGIFIEGDHNDIWNNQDKSSYWDISYNYNSGAIISGNNNNIYDEVDFEYNNQGHSTSYSGLELYGENNWVSESSFYANYIGIILDSSSDYNEIEYGDFDNGFKDIYCAGGDYNVLNTCVFFYNVELIYFSTNNQFDSCTFYTPLYLSGFSHYNEVIDTYFHIYSENYYGIFIQNCDYIEITRCDFDGEPQTTTAIKIYGCINVNIFGDSTSLSYITGIECALFADDYNDRPTTVYFKNYDIDIDIGIILSGSQEDDTYVYWNNIPNEEYLFFNIGSNAYWIYDDTF